ARQPGQRDPRDRVVAQPVQAGDRGGDRALLRRAAQGSVPGGVGRRAPSGDGDDRRHLPLGRPGQRGEAGIAQASLRVMAIASGLLLASAFLPLPLGWLAWFGLVPFLLALAELHEVRAPLKRFFSAGYLFGFAFYLVGLHWVALMSTAAMTMPWLRYPAWIAASAYLALFGGLAALFTGWLARQARFALPLAGVVGVFAVEELRCAGELGFPWFQLGYSQHAYLPMVQLASLGSVSLLTLWILVLNALATRALRRRPGRPLAVAACGLALALPWAWGSAALRSAPRAQ